MSSAMTPGYSYKRKSDNKLFLSLGSDKWCAVGWELKVITDQDSGKKYATYSLERKIPETMILTRMDERAEFFGIEVCVLCAQSTSSVK